jgi:predicted metal-dependent hydrolase
VRLDVRIEREARKTLALRVTPDGLVALIPRHLDPDSATVSQFVREGIEKLPQPEPLAEPLTREALGGVVREWAERLDVEVGRVQVREMRTKWASCSSLGTVTLNRDLLRVPRELVDYVICHELLHLRIPGHGKGWQAMMGVHMPDWRERERRLAGWGLRLAPRIERGEDPERLLVLSLDRTEE